MMPHPERACEALLGGEDGLVIWRSLLEGAGARVSDVPKKPLRFTRHARNRMRKLELPRHSVETCVDTPDLVTGSILGRKNHWRRHEMVICVLP